MRRDAKYIMFNSREEAERFTLLYGGFISSYDYFYQRYFGEKCTGKVVVILRATKDEMSEIASAIGLKDRRWNNKLVFVYE